MAKGQLSRGSARLVWVARVGGKSTAELAEQTSRIPEVVGMERPRAKYALRALVA